jgi:single-strand DNA-binding protein
MFDTYLTMVGNVLTKPELRRTEKTGQVVANFRVASTSRRFDRATNRWVDGNTLRLRVSCWRGLAEGVNQSLMVGDPVVVVGRLYTRDWIMPETNQARVAYEMDAVAVGHDLSRGQATFTRRKPTATAAIEDDESDEYVAGERTTLIGPPADHTGGADPDADGAYEDEFEEFELLSRTRPTDALELLRQAGLDPQLAEPAQGDSAGPPEWASVERASVERASAERADGDPAVPAEGNPAGSGGDDEDGVDGAEGAGPDRGGRRGGRRRQPVPA